MKYLMPSGVARRPVDFQRPEERYRRSGEKMIGDNMGENDEKTGFERQLGYAVEPLGRPGRRQAGQEGEHDAVRGSPVKGAAVVLKNKPEKHINVRQVGQNDHKQGDPPVACLDFAIGQYAVRRESDRGMADW